MKPLLLVVDDSPDIRSALIDLFEFEGYRVAGARDGVQAIELLTSEVPALIITDLRMPIMDGRALVKWVRRQAGLRHIPIIVYSSEATITPDTARERVVLLMKPAGSDLLIDLVRSLLANRNTTTGPEIRSLLRDAVYSVLRSERARPTAPRSRT